MITKNDYYPCDELILPSIKNIDDPSRGPYKVAKARELFSVSRGENIVDINQAQLYISSLRKNDIFIFEKNVQFFLGEEMPTWVKRWRNVHLTHTMR